jgi:hypothetical protein
MSGNNGEQVGLGDRRLSASDRGVPAPGAQSEQLLDGLADRLGDRIQGMLKEQMNREVFPRLNEIESKMEGLTRRVSEAGRPAPAPPAAVPASQRSIQRQARNRVD